MRAALLQPVIFWRLTSNNNFVLSFAFKALDIGSLRIPELDEFFYTLVFHIKYIFENKRKIHCFIR